MLLKGLNIKPVIPCWGIILILLAMAVFLCLAYAKDSRKVQLRYRILMIALEALCGLCLAVSLLQPMIRSGKPENGSYRLILLADKSGSMRTHDGGRKLSRSQFLANVLSEGNSTFAETVSRGRTECYAFANEATFLGNSIESLQRQDTLPGITPIGDVLQKVLEDSAATAQIGAVYLFSDGHSNGGVSPTEIAKRFKLNEIPINCIGIGSNASEWDISVKVDGRTIKLMRDEKLQIGAIVKSTFPKAMNVPVVLALNGGELERKEVEVLANGESKVMFERIAHTEGYQAYTISVQRQEGDAHNDNDLDYVSVSVKAPPVFRILFLLGGLDWEQRFINCLETEDGQFAFASIINTANDKYIRHGLTDEELALAPKLPQNTSFLEKFDAVVLDSRLAPKLSAEGIDAICSFVENKGGGLLVRGPLQLLPGKLLELMPVRETELAVLRKKSRLVCSSEFIFDKDVAGVVNSPGGIALGSDTPVFVMGGLKKAARVAASISGQESMPVLAGIAFGAGRTAYIGLENTWKWRMLNDTPAVHDAYWQWIFQWLSEIGKPRLRILNTEHTVAVGEDFTLDLAVSGDDFLAAPNASIMATVTKPDGGQHEVALEPQWEEEGRYSAVYIPTVPGLYHVSFDIALPERKLSCSTSFVARQVGPEAEDVSYREGLLRDIARISGGTFCRGRDFSNERNFAISSRLPMKYSIYPLVSTWWIFSVFSISFCLLWYIRRRIGLK